MLKHNGCFVVIEGPDGSGKTTIAKKIVERLNNEGHKAIYTREPGGTELGEKIRDIVLSTPLSDIERTFLFAASFASDINNIILPALDRGEIVVCDRFFRSTAIYQGYYKKLKNETPEEYAARKDAFKRIGRFIMNGEFIDLELILDVSPEVGDERINIRGESKDAIESEGYDKYKERCKAYYRSNPYDFVAKAMNLGCYRWLSADQYHIDTDNLSIVEVLSDCMEAIYEIKLNDGRTLGDHV